MSATVEETLRASGRFEAVTGMRYEEVQLGSDRIDEVAALDLGVVDEMFDLGLTEGALPTSEATDVIVLHEDVAADLGVDQVVLTRPDPQGRQLDALQVRAGVVAGDGRELGEAGRPGRGGRGW